MYVIAYSYITACRYDGIVGLKHLSCNVLDYFIIL